MHLIMNRLKYRYTLLVTLFFSLDSIALEKRYQTGIVREISESRIELDLSPEGFYSYIGFICEPEICITTREINIGDEVLLILSSFNKLNNLLSIRRCLPDDIECKKVKELNIEERIELEKEIEQTLERNK